MKKVILGLALSLISVVTFANHVDPLGQCGNSAFFITKIFDPNSVFEFRVRWTTNIFMTMTTGSKVTDSIFSVQIPKGTWIEFRQKHIDSTSFTDWRLAASSSNNTYANCALAVTLANFNVQKKDGGVVISFDDYGSQIKQYNIRASVNSTDWVTIKTVQSNGSQHYNIPIDLGLGLFFAPLLLLFSKKRKWLSLVAIVFVIGFYSCKKESTSTSKKDYKYFQIEVVNQSGSTDLSQIDHL